MTRAKFNPRSTYGLEAGDRVTLSNKEGDTASVVVEKVIDSWTFENPSGTVFKIAVSPNSDGWEIKGVEFAVPDRDGLYVSINGLHPDVIRKTGEKWFYNNQSDVLEEADLLDRLPLYRLVTMNEALDTIRVRFRTTSVYTKATYQSRDDANTILESALSELRER